MKLPKQCIMPLETGTNCEEISTRFYFDMQTKVCYPFEYTGCGPEVSNRFDTDEQCNKLCNENFVSENSTLNSTTEITHTQIHGILFLLKSPSHA